MGGRHGCNCADSESYLISVRNFIADARWAVWAAESGRVSCSPGHFTAQATAIYGLDSTGGWLQLKFKPKPNFELNFAYGEDQPFAGELKLFPGSALYYGYSISRNQSPFVNFIYRMRSDVLFSMEYKRLQTNALNAVRYIANRLIVEFRICILTWPTR